MKKQNIAKSAVLLSLTFPIICQAGTTAVGKEPMQPTAPVAENPLSFFGGKLIFDVQEKVRGEYRENNFDFNSDLDSPTDDSWLLQRFRFGAKLKPVPWLTLYAQGQDVREIGSDRPNVIGQMGAEGDDSFDLLQGYVEVGDPKSLSLKVGRQKFSYGDERIIGPLEWANQSRAFDAVKLHIERPTWNLDLFTSSVVQFSNGEFNRSDFLDSDSTRDQIFSGAYFSTTVLPFQITDIYLLNLNESGGTNFFTLGTRWKGLAPKLNNWDYTLETAVQFGEVKDKDLQAFGGHLDIGYNLVNTPWKPRVGVEYNYGTGDSDPKDGDVGTFQNLFPTNHKFYGYMDVFSLQNMQNVAINLSASPTDKLKLAVDAHAFWIVDTHDSWYRANGTTAVRPANAAASNYAGSEIDFTATYKATKWLGFQAGYSHFFAGDYLSDTGSGASSDADFVYIQAGIDF